jgi:hypothetical protein
MRLEDTSEVHSLPKKNACCCALVLHLFFHIPKGSYALLASFILPIFWAIQHPDLNNVKVTYHLMFYAAH